MKKAAFLLLLILPLAACETLADLNPFEKKQEPLKGDRKVVFEKGIEHDRSIPQPFNPSGKVVEPVEKTEPVKKKK
jgi:hypothetical protein